MKKIAISGIISCFMVIFCVQGVLAADATVAVDVNSAYIWRGITFNDGIVLQPSIDVSKGGFGINVWGNVDLDDYDDRLDSDEFSEVDLTLSYGFDIEPVEVSIGYIEYLFPAGGDGTREFFATLGMDLFEGLSAGIKLYYDFDEVDDIYINFGLGYSVPVSETFSLDFGASAGYMGDDASMGGESGFNEYVLSVGGSYSATEALSISASINYTDAIDEDVLPDGIFSQDVNFYGGISIAYNF